jgi:hypothetical protein
MKIERGNLWDRWERGDWIVITTNIGWDANGENNMGAGMALQAALRLSELPGWYGRWCRHYGAVTPVMAGPGGFLFFPVKPLLEEDPARSWDQIASPCLIERSARQLRLMLGELDAHLAEDVRVAMALPGCGNGGLSPADVLPILEEHLSDHRRFSCVDRVAGSA